MAQDYIIKIEGSWPSGETEYVIGTDNPERLPAVSASDNGDVLTVVEGKWQDAAPSAGGLPAVTAADNGDVLTVVDGAWDKAAPSGGGALIVNVVMEGETLSIDTKAGVLWAAIEAGTIIIVRVAPEGTAFQYLIISSADISADGYGFTVGEMVLIAATADDYPSITG